MNPTDPPQHRVGVVVEAPQHSGLWAPLDYLSPQPLSPGRLVRVPLGRRTVTGMVWALAAPADDGAAYAGELKPVAEVLADLPPLPDDWRALVAFAAQYYQRSLGEVALAALPPQLRELNGLQLARRLKRQPAAATAPRTTTPLASRILGAVLSYSAWAM